jgi:hypothetical protein
MRHIRSLIIGAVVAALSVTSLAASVSAMDIADKGKVAIVQGAVGVKVDVCVNGREIVSAMPFGKYTFRRLAPGAKALRVTKAAPGACKGAKIAYRAFKFPKGADYTIVLSKKKPQKVMVFDNAYPSGPYVSGVHRFFRNALDDGKVTFRHEARPLPLSPAAEPTPTWAKGDSTWSYLGIAVGGAPTYTTTWASEVPMLYPPHVVAGPIWAVMGKHQRYEWIVIGNERVQRMVLLRRNY